MRNGRLPSTVRVTGPLTIQVLDGYLRCGYPGFLRIAGQRGEISDYATSLCTRQASVRAAALEKIVRQFGDHVVASGILLTPDVLRGGAPFLLDSDLQSDDFSIRFDGLLRVRAPQCLVIFSPCLYYSEPTVVSIAPKRPYLNS